MALTKEQIFAIDDIEYKEVDVPKWGKVRIKVMSIQEQIDYGNISKNKKTEEDLFYAMIVLCCVDDQGKPLFTHDDVAFLKKKSSVAITHLFKECMSLNSINDDEIEREAKNS